MVPILEIQSVSKKFKIDHQRKPYLSLRESLTNFFVNFNTVHEDFYALRDINLKINQGETVGIIGKNGAGKSTLLKILSRITPPSKGRIVLRGRIASLLEVGTGFHLELSGRENVFLNGSILGMKKKEIEKRFDEIVDFSGVEKFLDTPLKHYSSGMQLRLAFAVAAFLEPEILIIDEVLAVGDAEFQKKCMGKMDEVSKSGRTILFVSHNMTAVSSLCKTGILLDKGSIVYNGDVEECIRLYSEKNLAEALEWRGDAGNERVKLLHTWIISTNNNGCLYTTSDLEIGIEIEVLKPVTGLVLGFTLFSQFNYELAYTLFDDHESSLPPMINPGRMIKKFVIPANTLAKGTYHVEFDVGIHNTQRIINNEGTLTFTLDNIDGRGRRFSLPDIRGRVGLFRPSWLKS